MALILAVLDSEAVQYQCGQPVEQVVGGVMDLVEDIKEGRPVGPPVVLDDDPY
ncbi:hypothetical protein GFY24_12180 [Nocardia sp. SYP-A9097]|nr:hypothetical protein [Nocardia sp. SYP-A9097]